MLLGYWNLRMQSNVLHKHGHRLTAFLETIKDQLALRPESLSENGKFS